MRRQIIFCTKYSIRVTDCQVTPFHSFAMEKITGEPSRTKVTHRARKTEGGFQLKYDVAFIAGKHSQKINAMGCFLRNISPVFQQLLDGESEKKKFIVVPRELEASSIEVLVDFSFGLRPRVTAKNLFNIRATAKFYGVETLVAILDKTLEMTMKNEQHFCWVLHSACMFMDKPVITQCLKLFETELDQRKVLSSNYFLCLDYEPDLWLLVRTKGLKVGANELSERLEDWSRAKHLPSQSLDMLKSFIATNSHQYVTAISQIEQVNCQTEPEMDFLDEPEKECDCKFLFQSLHFYAKTFFCLRVSIEK